MAIFNVGNEEMAISDHVNILKNGHPLEIQLDTSGAAPWLENLMIFQEKAPFLWRISGSSPCLICFERLPGLPVGSFLAQWSAVAGVSQASTSCCAQIKLQGVRTMTLYGIVA